MRIGAMTNPYKELLPQIHWIGKNGFDYVDLAVEPPEADIRNLAPREIADAAAAHDLSIVVHTSPYLPLASRHASSRRAAWKELDDAIRLADALGSSLVTLHYLGGPVFYSLRKIASFYADMLNHLQPAAKAAGIKVAIENNTGNPSEVSILREIFTLAPEAGLLLDLGHTHLKAPAGNAAAFLHDPIIGKRLVHVHISDNNGASDLHLPLGAARNGIDWKRMIDLLRRHPYDGTITVEVFAPDPDYLLLSRDKLARWWQET